jgi:dihydroorotate dehydrogenase (fumarate)
VRAGGDNGKPYIVSLSGKSLADNLEMFGRACAKTGVAAVELNLACPNVIGHPIIAYDFDQMKTVLDKFLAHPSFGTKPLGIKLPPYFDMPHFEKAAAIINAAAGIRFVVSTNTVGNALVVDTHAEQPLIRPKGGFGGVAGGLVKYTALANVKKMRELLRDDIDVVGAGGVCTGADAFELILCGAAAVQVGTQHMKEGPKCFGRIADELRALMEEKGYEKLSDFRGKLRPWDKARAAASRKAAKLKADGGDGEGAGSSGGAGGGSNLPVWIIAALLAVIAVLLAERQLMQGRLLAAGVSE